MDFEFTDEQRLLQDTVRRFVDDRILPNAVENDIEHRLDLDAIAGMAELGILGIVIPEEHGGAGLDFVCEALACEEIERGEAAFRTLISVHVGHNSLALLKYGYDEPAPLLLLGRVLQQRERVEPHVDGDQRPKRRLAALDLLARERLGHEVEPRAAVLLRDHDPEDPEL